MHIKLLVSDAVMAEGPSPEIALILYTSNEIYPNGGETAWNLDSCLFDE